VNSGWADDFAVFGAGFSDFGITNAGAIEG
jgi:hypothetical protein